MSTSFEYVAPRANEFGRKGDIDALCAALGLNADEIAQVLRCDRNAVDVLLVVAQRARADARQHGAALHPDDDALIRLGL